MAKTPIKIAGRHSIANSQLAAIYQRPNAGFSLVEIMVVVGIIGLLAGVLFPVFKAARRASKDTVARSNLGQLAKAANLYIIDNDYSKFPDSPLVLSDYLKTKEVFIDPSDPFIREGGAACKLADLTMGNNGAPTLFNKPDYCGKTGGFAMSFQGVREVVGQDVDQLSWLHDMINANQMRSSQYVSAQLGIFIDLAKPLADDPKASPLKPDWEGKNFFRANMDGSVRSYRIPRSKGLLADYFLTPN